MCPLGDYLLLYVLMNLSMKRITSAPRQTTQLLWIFLKNKTKQNSSKKWKDSIFNKEINILVKYCIHVKWKILSG